MAPTAAPVTGFPFSAALLFLLISSPILSLQGHNCPHIWNSSNIESFRRPSNDTLLVVVPWKRGFEQFVNFNPATCLIDGFSVQVFLQALHHMPKHARFHYQFVLHGNGYETPSYNDMIKMVVKGDVDAVVADLTITSKRMEKVGFTIPYLASNLVMVTTYRYGSAGTLWDFLKPFSAPLWYSFLACFAVTGLVLYLLENKNPDFSTAPVLKRPLAAPSPDSSSHGRSSSPSCPANTATSSAKPSVSPSAPSPAPAPAPAPEYISAFSVQNDNTYLQCLGPPIYDQASHKRRILNAYWFTSLCVFQAQQESVRTHSGRVVTGIWLLSGFIFFSSYVASLASLLSAETKYPTIQGFQALLSDKEISVGCQAGSFIADYLKILQIDQKRLKTITSEIGYINALNEGNGKPDGVGAVLDEQPYTQILLQSQCFYTRDPTDDKLPSWGGFAFAFRKNSPVLEEMSKMIVAMQEDETLMGLQNWWGIGGAKSDSCSSAEEEPSHLRLRSFGGLFGCLGVVYAVCVAWCLLSKADQSVWQTCTEAFASAKALCNICRGESLRRRSGRVLDASDEHNDASCSD